MQVMQAFARQGLKGVVVSLEMDTDSLAERTIEFLSPIPKEHWRQERAALDRQVEQHFDGLAEVIIAQDLTAADQIYQACKLHRDERGIEVVLIDYAQLVAGEGRTLYERVTDATKTIARIRRELGLLTILLAQVGRDIEKRHGRDGIIPRLSDLKDSGQLEQDADVVIFGVWPIKIDPKHRPYDDYLMMVAKNRARGSDCELIKLRFDGARKMVADPITQSNFNQELWI
jgi:replicative DNA helicase